MCTHTRTYTHTNKQHYSDQWIELPTLFVSGNLTPFAKQAIKEMSAHGYRMEYFRDAELLVDITEHKLVPGEDSCWSIECGAVL